MEWLSQLNKQIDKGEPTALITITEVKGSSPRDVGAKMLANQQGRLWGTIGGGKLEELILQDCKKAFSYSRPQKWFYPLSEKAGQCCGGSVEVLVEVFNTNPRLFVFGAGHIGSQLAQTLTGSVFSIHIVDSRAEWALSPHLADCVYKYHIEPLDFLKKHNWQKDRDYAVVMTHDHALDQHLIKELAPLSLEYLGLIGSQTKWRRFQIRLQKEGIPESLLRQIHCPVGLDIGGETPQEIAISIGAELIKHHYQKQAAPQKNKTMSTIWDSEKNDPCELQL